MPGSPFDVRELFVLARSLEAGAGRLPREVQMAVTDALADTVTWSKELSPYATGANRDSIDSEVEYTATGAYGSAGPRTPYGGYLELGTSLMAPRPYMFPAADKAVAELEARLGELL